MQMSDNKYIKIFILICSLLYTCKTKEQNDINIDKQDKKFRDLSQISMLLSLFVIFASNVKEIPQIYEIYSKKSVEGISFQSVYQRLISGSIVTLIAIDNKSEFILYAENIGCCIQYMAILIAFIFFDKEFKNNNKFLQFSCIYVALMVLLQSGELINIHMHQLKVLFAFIGTFSSKIPQIYKNWINKDTGVLSYSTTLVSAMTASFRFLTLYLDNKHIDMIIQYGIYSCFNIFIFIQLVYYTNQNKKIRKN